MTRFSKVFAVFSTVASLIFLGAAAITSIAGPNFRAEHVEDLPEYVFEEIQVPEGPSTWTVKARKNLGDKKAGETIKSGAKSLPDAVLAARKHFSTYQVQRIDQLETRTKALDAEIAAAKLYIAKDLDALKRRESELQQEMVDLRQQIKDLSDQNIAKAQAAQGVRQEAAKRREDVARLTNQLAELRTDLYRIEEQQRKLRNVLVRLDGSIARAESRNEELTRATSSGGPKPYDENSPPAPPAGPE